MKFCCASNASVKTQGKEVRGQFNYVYIMCLSLVINLSINCTSNKMLNLQNIQKSMSNLLTFIILRLPYGQSSTPSQICFCMSCKIIFFTEKSRKNTNVGLK